MVPKFKAQNRNLNIIDISKGVEKIGGNPHIWLSPKSLKVMAENVSKALIDFDENQSGSYRANLKDYIEKLDNLDREIREFLKGVESRAFLVFHHSWGLLFAKGTITLLQIWPGTSIRRGKVLPKGPGRLFIQELFKLKAQKKLGVKVGNLFQPPKEGKFSRN